MPRYAGVAISMLALALAACGKPNGPTQGSVTVTIAVPSADPTVIEAGKRVYLERLRTLGIGSVQTHNQNESLQFTFVVPRSVDTRAVDLVFSADGVVELAPWPSGEEAPMPGDRAPKSVMALFDGSTGFESAHAMADASGQAGIEVALTPTASEMFASYTTAHVGESLTVLLDRVVIAAPTIQTPITEGDLVIIPDASAPYPPSALAAIIESGPVPVAWRKN